MSKEIEFDAALARLDEIVKTLESGKCSLEESIKLFEEGTSLSKVCYTKINTAKLKIETMLENGEDNANE